MKSNYIGRKVRKVSLPGVEPLVPIGGQGPSLQAILDLVPEFWLKPGLGLTSPNPPANIISFEVVEVGPEGLLTLILLVVGQVGVVVQLSKNLFELDVNHVKIIYPKFINGDITKPIEGPAKLRKAWLVAGPGNEVPHLAKVLPPVAEQMNLAALNKD